MTRSHFLTLFLHEGSRALSEQGLNFGGVNLVFGFTDLISGTMKVHSARLGAGPSTPTKRGFLIFCELRV